MTTPRPSTVLDSLATPVVAAPMAGGPSTPALVVAAGEAGALGVLAGAYLSAERLAADIAAVRAGTDAPFGVNLFVPDPDERPADPRLDAYRDALTPLAERFGAAPLPEPSRDDDAWDAKVDVVERERVPLVTFTFGLPDRSVVERLRTAGSELGATVTSVLEAEGAAALGVDLLVVQGPEAGGHRGTLRTADTPGETPLRELVSAIAARTSLPIVAAGGITTRDDVEAVLAAGASAAQVGTALLLADEAGTSAVHRAALADPRFERTVVTRAFTGRAARGLANRFTEEFEGLVPDRFPDVNSITSPVRKAAAAAGDPDWVHLWAGTGWRAARAAPAREILAGLAPDTGAAPDIEGDAE